MKLGYLIVLLDSVAGYLNKRDHMHPYALIKLSWVFRAIFFTVISLYGILIIPFRLEIVMYRVQLNFNA